MVFPQAEWLVLHTLDLGLNMKEWYAAYTKPRSEKKAAERLAKDGWEVYCPIKTEIRQWKDRKKKVEVPFFPSYVFVSMENYEKQRVEVLTDPALLNFVFWLQKPAVITDKEMQAVMAFFAKHGSQNIEVESIEVGTEMVLKEGLLTGYKGVVEKVSKNKVFLVIPSLGRRLVVNVDVIQY